MKAHHITTGLPGLSDFLLREYDPTYCTDKRAVLAGVGGVRKLPLLCLIALVHDGAATVTAGAPVSPSGGVPGNGAVNALTVDAGALSGVYNVIIIEPAANAGTFQVIRPDGKLDGLGVVGAAYNGSINFTLADGATDWAAGDRIPITVAYPVGSEKLVRWDPTATNGAQTIKGINCFETEAPEGEDGDPAPFLARGPIVGRREAIAFHDGATADHKAAAFARLAELGIQCEVSG
jgi:hypothetical protein